jgi:hypothetical protein
MGRVLLTGTETEISLPRPDKHECGIATKDELARLVEEAIRSAEKQDKDNKEEK